MSRLETMTINPVSDRTDRMNTVLIGSAEAVREMNRALGIAGIGLEPRGCILIPPLAKPLQIDVPSLGPLSDLPMIVRAHRIGLAFVCIPSAMHKLAQRVIAQLEEHGVSVRCMPTLRDQVDGRVGRVGAAVDPMRLLNRPARSIDERAVASILRDKRVMITGAGGSIGSQLAHIVAGFEPARIILMDRAENNLFEIDRHIGARFTDIERSTILHDVTEADRTMALAQAHRPHIIFHAAAHKHVPMMEDHPRAALVNNFYGTHAIADAAVATGAERFVMISTDKAVNPSSVMGATKRAAEIYVQHLAAQSDTRCSMVRFGNVLGSACSVLPIWSQQLAEGGPLTVTDERMTRYFMTIPEAAALVVQAAALDDNSGHIFLLDMGEPVSIIDMAGRFIREHGLTPDQDVQIVLTGARPGEKLHEELAYDHEDKLPTAHPAIARLNTKSLRAADVIAMCGSFDAVRHNDDRAAILAALRSAVGPMASIENTRQQIAPALSRTA